MPLLLLFLFIVVPIAELYVIIQVGEAIGVLWTILLLIADSILGSMLMRSQGRAAWRRFNAAIAEGRMPGREVADGALVILGGAFLLAPGFLTDAVGLLLLLPPTRAVLRRFLLRGALGRIAVAMPGMATPPGERRAGFGGPRRGEDVDGTAHDVSHDRDRLRP